MDMFKTKLLLQSFLIIIVVVCILVFYVLVA